MPESSRPRTRRSLLSDVSRGAFGLSLGLTARADASGISQAASTSATPRNDGAQPASGNRFVLCGRETGWLIEEPIDLGVPGENVHVASEGRFIAYILSEPGKIPSFPTALRLHDAVRRQTRTLWEAPVPKEGDPRYRSAPWQVFGFLGWFSGGTAFLVNVGETVHVVDAIRGAMRPVPNFKPGYFTFSPTRPLAYSGGQSKSLRVLRADGETATIECPEPVGTGGWFKDGNRVLLTAVEDVKGVAANRRRYVADVEAGTVTAVESVPDQELNMFAVHSASSPATLSYEGVRLPGGITTFLQWLRISDSDAPDELRRLLVSTDCTPVIGDSQSQRDLLRDMSAVCYRDNGRLFCRHLTAKKRVDAEKYWERLGWISAVKVASTVYSALNRAAFSGPKLFPGEGTERSRILDRLRNAVEIDRFVFLYSQDVSSTDVKGDTPLGYVAFPGGRVTMNFAGKQGMERDKK